MKSIAYLILLSYACCLLLTPATATTSRFGSIKPSEYVVTAESDPTVPSWAKAATPPPTCDTNAVQGIINRNVETNYLCTLAAANAKYLPLAGGTMTGDLGLGGNNQIVFNGGETTIHKSWIGYSSGSVFLPSQGIFTFPQDGGELLTKETAAETYAPTSTAVTVSQWENYWSGDKVRLSVTNYYGNTSGELPRLRIEEFDHSTTTTVAGVEYVTNYFKVVWDEHDRHTNYQATVDAKVDAVSNATMTAAFMQTANQLAGKAPRNWGSVSSAGGAAPANTVWMAEPNTVFAGGTEYAHVACGEGAVSVLTTKGAAVYTEGENGVFRIKDDSGDYYFGFDVGTTYTIGCRTDGIVYDASSHLVTLTYDLTSENPPNILTCTNLTTGTWSAATVTWAQNPPAGTQVAYVNVGTTPQGFYKATLTAGSQSKFVTNMQADLQGGILATNETTGATTAYVPIVPVYNNGTVTWKLKQ